MKEHNEIGFDGIVHTTYKKRDNCFKKLIIGGVATWLLITGGATTGLYFTEKRELREAY